MRRVVIITGNRLSSDALSLVLAGTEFTIVAASPPIRVGTTVANTVPDLVLVDLERGDELLAVLEAVRATHPRGRIVVVSSHRGAHHVVPAIEHGARGFLLRDRTSDELLDGFREVVNGGVVIDPRVASRFVTAATRGARVSGPYGLSRQEQLVVGHLPRRMTNGQIGQEVGIATSTVKTHLRSAFRKLGVNNRQEAAMFAAEHGLA